MNIYKRKIAYLVSLLMQVKAIAPRELNDVFDTGNIERFLDMPKISDREWELESLENQLRFLSFLNANIFYYDRILKLLKEEGFKF